MGNSIFIVANRLAKRLKQLRAQQGLTQATLAERAGVTLGYIGRLEIGRHDPQLSTLYKLAKALRVSIAELVS
jgi:transcriptional regulator with XRE-family HTH domain